MLCFVYCGVSKFYLLNGRDSIGASAITGDLRWAGSFGVNIDFVARSHCSVEIILLEDMIVSDTLAVHTVDN
jgi:hypothetical protein